MLVPLFGVFTCINQFYVQPSLGGSEGHTLLVVTMEIKCAENS